MWLSVLVFIKFYSCLKCHFNEKRKLSKRLLHFNNCLWIILAPFSLVRITLSQGMTKEAPKCLVLKINSKYFILYNSKLNSRISFSVSGLDRLIYSEWFIALLNNQEDRRQTMYEENCHQTHRSFCEQITPSKEIMCYSSPSH